MKHNRNKYLLLNSGHSFFIDNVDDGDNYYHLVPAHSGLYKIHCQEEETPLFASLCTKGVTVHDLEEGIEDFHSYASIDFLDFSFDGDENENFDGDYEFEGTDELESYNGHQYGQFEHSSFDGWVFDNTPGAYWK